MENKRYNSVNGLRTIACIGIVMMHLRANNPYSINGFFYNDIIPAFTDFVFLFMVISAFGMCCGYYDKINRREIDFNSFYKKRCLRILPFFSVLVLLDVIMEPCKDTVIQGIADISLLFGLFPNNIEVIGVGWFLGLVFAFYLIFPFYCTLISGKVKAWFSLIGAVVMNFILGGYFEVGMTNIVYSLCFFIAGGVIFLYKASAEKLPKWISLPSAIAAAAAYFIIGANVFTQLILSGVLLICAISKDSKILNNKFTGFISGISMEIYLSHMVIFRAMEKVHLNTVIQNDTVQYAFTTVCCFVLTVLFAFVLKKIIGLMTARLFKG